MHQKVKRGASQHEEDASGVSSFQLPGMVLGGWTGDTKPMMPSTLWILTAFGFWLRRGTFPSVLSARKRGLKSGRAFRIESAPAHWAAQDIYNNDQH